MARAAKAAARLCGQRVLVLGCGWHRIWAAEHGAADVIGTDISRKMLEAAREKTAKSPDSHKTARAL